VLKIWIEDRIVVRVQGWCPEIVDSNEHVKVNIYYINVNVPKLGSKAGNFLSGKREGERDKGDR
jgi:hypothetical protein